MEKTSTWATTNEMFVISTLLRCAVASFSRFGNRRVWQLHQESDSRGTSKLPPDCKIIYLDNVNDNHFEVVRKLETLPSLESEGIQKLKEQKRIQLKKELETAKQDFKLSKTEKRKNLKRIRMSLARLDLMADDLAKRRQQDKTRRDQKREQQTNDEKERERILNAKRFEAYRHRQTAEDKIDRENYMKEKQKALRNNKKDSPEKRRQSFDEKVRFGPIFPCISCEQLCFENGVIAISEKYQEEIHNSDFLSNTLNDNIFDERFQVCLKLRIDGENQVKSGLYWCHTCFNHLKRKKLPPMCSKNNLFITNLPHDLNTFSHLEESLVAKKLLFQKIFPLKISRMPAIKDKMIMIPMRDNDILNTVNKLPRIPIDSGLIDVMWKRKLSMRNYHLQAKVDVNKIFRLLQCLKELKNPFYEFYDNEDLYRERCLHYDKAGYENIFGTEQDFQQEIDLKDGSDVSSNRKEEHESNNSEEEKEQEYYEKNDPIRKFQIDYDNINTVTPKYPEAFEIDGSGTLNKLVVVAPGEGKYPENVLFCENWDALAFPTLYPDGRYNLHEKRKVKLLDQFYFKQRLNNINPKFRNNVSYVFAAEYYLSRKSLQRNIDLSFMRGTKNVTASGKTVYTLDDGFSVFDNVSNTPAYHRKARFEQMARLDNLGAFQVFFTFSSAETRWKEHLSSFLVEKGVKVIYNVTKTGSTDILVEKGNGDEIPLKEYLETMDEKLNQLLRKNVFTATRIFKHRFQTFLHEVILNKSNPMSVQDYSLKVEYQGRGAAHYHGLLWLDLEKLDKKVKIKDFRHSITEFNYDIKDITTEEEQLHYNELIELGKEEYLSSEEQSRCENLRESFPFHRIRSAFRKLRISETLTGIEEEAIIRFINAFSSVSLHPATSGIAVSEIAREVNVHHHTKTCKKYGTKNCRFKFPKFPSLNTLLSKPLPIEMPDDIKDKYVKYYGQILQKVMEGLQDKNLIPEIMSHYEKDKETRSEIVSKMCYRLDDLLTAVGLNEHEKKDYHDAIAYRPIGYGIIFRRDIDETMVNAFNPEWTVAWNGNTDFQITLDFYAVIEFCN